MNDILEPQNPARAVGFLDMSDLQCCGHQMEPCTSYDNHRATKGYGCLECGSFVTQIGFLQNHHGTQEARRARIATMTQATGQRAAA